MQSKLEDAALLRIKNARVTFSTYGHLNKNGIKRERRKEKVSADDDTEEDAKATQFIPAKSLHEERNQVLL